MTHITVSDLKRVGYNQKLHFTTSDSDVNLIRKGVDTYMVDTQVCLGFGAVEWVPEDCSLKQLIEKFNNKPVLTKKFVEI